MKVIGYITYFSYIIDILINFFTSFYEKGNLITDRYKICKYYLKKGSFISDLITLLALELPIEGFSLLFLFRIIKTNELFNRIEKFLFASDTIYNLLSLFKLILNILFLSHIFACIWYYIGFKNQDSGKTWLIKY